MAQNVIDALVVTLGLDAAAFAKGATETEAAQKKIRDSTKETGRGISEGIDRSQRDSNESYKKLRDGAATTAKELESRGKQAASFFTKFQGGALGILGVVAGGDVLKDFVQNTMTADAAMGRLAATAGTSTPKMSAWAALIQQAGGSGGAVTSEMTNMSLGIENMKLGNGMWSGLASLNRMQIPLNDAHGNTRDTSDIMVDIAKWMHSHSAPLDAAYGQRFGLSVDTVNAMRQLGTPDLSQNLAASVTLTQQQADAAAALQKSTAQLDAQFAVFKNQMFKELEPQLEKMVVMLQGVDWKGLASKFGWLTAPPKNPSILDQVETDAAAAGKDVRDGFLDVWSYTGGRSQLADHQGLDGVAPIIQDASSLPGRAASWAKGLFAGQSLTPDVADAVNKAAMANGIDPKFLRALATTEGGGYDKISSAGAIGPMQLMPGTAADNGVTNVTDWRQNVQGGARYFAKLLKQFNGNYLAAAAAYNAGPNNTGVKYFAQTGDPSRLPQETRNYIGTIAGDVDSLRMPVSAPALSPPSARPRGGNSGGSHGNDASTVNVTLNTPSTDPAAHARSVAAAVQKALKPKMMVAQANGLAPW